MPNADLVAPEFVPITSAPPRSIQRQSPPAVRLLGTLDAGMGKAPLGGMDEAGDVSLLLQLNGCVRRDGGVPIGTAGNSPYC
jgi:hypothetical protein